MGQSQFKRTNTELRWRRWFTFLLIVLSTLLIILIISSILPLADSVRARDEVTKTQLLRLDNEWIVQITISNHSSVQSTYDINVSRKDNKHHENIDIPGGRAFVFTYHARPVAEDDGRTDFTIYKEGSSEPVKQMTYYFN